MSLNSKLQAALGVVFILTTAGAIDVPAQTQTAVGSYPISTILKPDSIKEPEKVKAARPSATSGENVATRTEKTAEVNGEEDSSDVRRASAPSTTTGPRLETATASRPQAAPDDKWQFQVTPYFWLESLHGNAGLGNRTAQVDQSFSDLFHDLDFFIMGAFEARKGKLVSLTTMEYTDISDDKATPGPFFSDAKANFKQFIFDSEVGYRLYDDPDKGSSVDVLGGIRVWHVSTELNFGAGILPAVNVDGSRNWVDAVAGLRGKAALSKKVFLTGKFDVGGGGSKFTYQVFGGAGYNLTPKIALIGGYRVLDVDYNKNNFVYDMNQRGPILGLGFRF